MFMQYVLLPFVLVGGFKDNLSEPTSVFYQLDPFPGIPFQYRILADLCVY